ncbi:MAG: response regulator [Candidatus Parabeggiatoa sp.]|nr:response regulator [Candidatus Parabeggiatoa sp.]
MFPPLNNILYVDDDESLRTIVQIALEDIGGYTLKICSSGLEAIETASHSEFLPDLILLDVMMPNMDGPTTLQKLRETEPKLNTVPVIFMTGKVQFQEEYKKRGVLDVITKPFDPMTLADRLQKLWETHYE